ncbi:MAG TPA: peroxiredoxin [Acidobacteriaceae bacterium]|nr:peroxiredoxin [Acidobacteriaceae bacterium]
MSFIATPDWSTLPVPEDDGAARHLPGLRLPPIPLVATDGLSVNLESLAGRVVLFIYPRTGVPDQPNPPGWDQIPGARGCTTQCNAFRDAFAELRALGVDHLYGLSTQSTADQREMAERQRLPFPILSDEAFALTRALRLPTFEASGMTLLKRLTLIAQDAVIEQVFYPVFPPDQNAAEVAAWLRGNLSRCSGS